MSSSRMPQPTNRTEPTFRRNTGTTDGLIVSFTTPPHAEGGTVREHLLD